MTWKLFVFFSILALSAILPKNSFAQSDNRWFAIFYMTGQNGQGTDRSTGNQNKPQISKANDLVLRTLDHMGVPYKIFSLPDSAGGWASTMGATRPTTTINGIPPPADSAWFRMNGCMGWIHVMDFFGNTGTWEIGSYFTAGNAADRGVPRGSPISGDWKIPGLMLSYSAITNGSFSNGISSREYVGGTGAVRANQRFANGDSISMQQVYYAIVNPDDASKITPIIGFNGVMSDSLVAWVYKTNCLYYYYHDAVYNYPATILLGLADLIQRAKYTPRRKLNLHMTLDHLFPDESLRTAPTESTLVYFNALNIRASGAIEAHSSERSDDNAATAAIIKESKYRFPSHPHSHNVLNFNSSWNLSTFADSATKRLRWNFLEKAITDTIGLVPAYGYERNVAFANNDVYYPDLYIMAQAGYTDIRAWAGIDSTGHLENLKEGRKVKSARSPSTPVTTIAWPYRYTEPTTGRGIYVHDCIESPQFNDSAIVDAITEDLNDSYGVADHNLSSIARMILVDGDWYWHPDVNLKGSSDMPAGIMPLLFRRFTYFYGRVKNILTIEPSYRPVDPRKM